MLFKKSYIFTFVLILLTFQFACGQTKSDSNIKQTKIDEKVDSRYENLKIQSEQLIQALNKNDLQKFVEMTHPLVIREVGGRENLISMMKNVIVQNPKIFETISISVGNPTEIIESGELLFGVVPQNLEGITHGKHKVVSNDCVVGVSSDNGANWKFVSGEKFDELFPSSKGKLQIIAQQTFVDGVKQ